MKYTTVTIGIAAFNEEKNIKKLLTELLNQKQEGWTLDGIVLNCDGCTDKTVSEAKSIQSPLIRIVDNQERKGKSARIHELCASIKSEMLVFFDADITLADDLVVTHLVQEFSKDRKCAVVGGSTRPFKPQSFFQRAVYASFLVFEQSRKKIKHGHNIFGCNGGCMAVQSDFARTLQFPDLANDDDFIYFSCIKSGFHFRHVANAVVYYKLPTTLADFLRQSFRSNPEAVKVNLYERFGSLVSKEYHRSFIFYTTCVLNVFKKYPAETIVVSAITILCKPFYPLIAKKYKLEWFTAKSTK